jgi:hypothetical protein
VWNLLDENRRSHKCNFWLLRGVVGDQPVDIAGTFYSTRTVGKSNLKRSSRLTKHPGATRCPTSDGSVRRSEQLSKEYYTYEELQTITKFQFSALLIDCEGCIETLFRGNTSSLGNMLRLVNVIILEADMPVGAADCTHDCVDYSKWIHTFSSIGLHVIHKEKDRIYPKIYHYVFLRNTV